MNKCPNRSADKDFDSVGSSFFTQLVLLPTVFSHECTGCMLQLDIWKRHAFWQGIKPNFPHQCSGIGWQENNFQISLA